MWLSPQKHKASTLFFTSVAIFNSDARSESYCLWWSHYNLQPDRCQAKIVDIHIPSWQETQNVL